MKMNMEQIKISDNGKVDDSIIVHDSPSKFGTSSKISDEQRFINAADSLEQNSKQLQQLLRKRISATLNVPSEIQNELSSQNLSSSITPCNVKSGRSSPTSSEPSDNVKLEFVQAKYEIDAKKISDIGNQLRDTQERLKESEDMRKILESTLSSLPDSTLTENILQCSLEKCQDQVETLEKDLEMSQNKICEYEIQLKEKDAIIDECAKFEQLCGTKFVKYERKIEEMDRLLDDQIEQQDMKIARLRELEVALEAKDSQMQDLNMKLQNSLQMSFDSKCLLADALARETELENEIHRLESEARQDQDKSNSERESALRELAESRGRLQQAERRRTTLECIMKHSQDVTVKSEVEAVSLLKALINAVGEVQKRQNLSFDEINGAVNVQKRKITKLSARITALKRYWSAFFSFRRGRVGGLSGGIPSIDVPQRGNGPNRGREELELNDSLLKILS